MDTEPKRSGRAPKNLTEKVEREVWEEENENTTENREEEEFEEEELGDEGGEEDDDADDDEDDDDDDDDEEEEEDEEDDEGKKVQEKDKEERIFKPRWRFRKEAAFRRVAQKENLKNDLDTLIRLFERLRKLDIEYRILRAEIILKLNEQTWFRR
jgi:hypothetical protein